MVVVLGCSVTAPAFAADTAWYTGARTQDPTRDWVVDVGADLSVDSHGSLFASLSGTMAPAGTLSESGARIRIEANAGRYSYRSDAVGPVNATRMQGAALAGYSFVWSQATLSAYAGIDLQNDTQSPVDPNNAVNGNSAGAKFVVEGSTRPSDRTLLTGYASFSSNHDSYYARLQAGYRLTDRVYVGPEIGVLGDDFFNQWRIGAHVTGLAFGPVRVSASAGYLNDSKQGPGLYTGLDVRAGF
jgi:hypothetical protein